MLLQVDVLQGPKPDGYVELPRAALGIDKRAVVGTLESSKVAFRVVIPNSEGQARFNIIQSSLEDAQGIRNMQSLKRLPGNEDDTFMGLFSPTVFNAVFMLDFWNPVYSWKRGCLMQYVPQTTSFIDKDGVYDLESRFIDNVKKSPFVMANIADSPEYQFIQLLKIDITVHQKKVTAYFDAIQKRMKDDPIKALEDYLSLAESRRRIYRPLPLNEFGSSLPYALGIPYDNPHLEMTADGNVQPMPQRGLDFFASWTTSLAGVNPIIIPASTSKIAPVIAAALPRPSSLALSCQTLHQGGQEESSLGTHPCPFVAKRHDKNVRTFNALSRRGTGQAPKRPNWTENILPMIQAPYWVSGDKKQKGAHWIAAMKSFSGWSLDNYDDVKEKSTVIYEHLRSKSMPITPDPQDYWPEEALETFREWANSGYPKNESDVIIRRVVIKKPETPAVSYRIRRDIMSLSEEELAIYQSKLENILKVGVLGSKWQELGLVRKFLSSAGNSFMHTRLTINPQTRNGVFTIRKQLSFGIVHT
jgi:hypothetical protein